MLRTPPARLHWIVAQRFSDDARVDRVAVADPAEIGVGVLQPRQRVEHPTLGVRRRGASNAPVPPVDHEVVVRPDALHQAGAVTGLRDVVVARVVHDRRAGPLHPARERLAAQRVHGIVGRRHHVVTQAQAVSHFVVRDVRQHQAHQRIGERQRLGARIGGAGLRPVPRFHQARHVVIEPDVGVHDLAGTRIADAGSVGVFDRGRQPPDRVEPGVVESKSESAAVGTAR